MLRRPPRSPLFPYPALFRSRSTSSARTWGASPVASRTNRASFSAVGSARTHRSRSPAEGAAGAAWLPAAATASRSEEHTSELQSRQYLECRLLLEKQNL